MTPPFIDINDISSGMRLLGLIGAAMIGTGLIWRKGAVPLYRHGKRVSTGVIAASELIQAQMGGLVEKVDSLLVANTAEIAELARVAAVQNQLVVDVARIDHEQTLVAERLEIEKEKVAALLKSDAADIRTQLREDLNKVRMEQVQIADSLAIETGKTAEVLARTRSLDNNTMGQLQQEMESLRRSHELTNRRLGKVEGLLVTLTKQGIEAIPNRRMRNDHA